MLFQIQLEAQINYVPSVHLSQDDGLEQSSVRAITEDHFGQIWFGTQLGLQYWNGNEIQKRDEVKSGVLDLVSRDSFVYCLSLNAITKINVFNNESKQYVFDKADYRQVVFVKKGLYVFSYLLRDTLKLNYNLDLTEYNLGVVDELKDKKLGRQEIQLSNGKILVENNQAIYIGKDSTQLSSALDSKAIAYGHNRAFIASQGGLIEVIENDSSFNKRVFLNGSRVESLFRDRNENLWVGTAGSGLYMFHRLSLLNTFYEVKERGNEPAKCWSFFNSPQGLYVASSKGLVNLSRETKDLNESLTKNLFCVSGVYADGITLIGTASSGVYKIYNSKLKNAYQNKKLSLDNTIMGFVKNEHGILAYSKIQWIQFDKQGEFLYSKSYGPEMEKAYVMSLDLLENNYLAATTLGIREYNIELNTIKQYASPQARVFSMLARYKDNWWAASMDSGLFKLKNDKIVQVDFPDQQLLGIKAVNETLWVNSFKTVYKYSHQKSKPYQLENGFPLAEYNQSNIHLNDEGVIYYSGVGGVFRFNPKSDSFQLALPKWMIYRNGKMISPEDEINLHHKETQLFLEANAIALSDQNRFELSYKIDNEWKPFSNFKKLIIDVEPGKSNLLFQIANKHSGEKTIQKFGLNRARPFWMSYWFLTLLGVLAIITSFGIYFLVQFIKTRKLLKIEESENKLSQERLRISRELHDNIGARLSYIISSLDVEKFKSDKSNTELDEINSFAKETMVQLRETIWAVGDESIFLSELSARVEHYISSLNKISGNKISFKGELKKDIELNSTQTINFYRIIQEALNNSLKYSHAKNIEVRIEYMDPYMTFSVKDDGKGFDQQAEFRGSGIIGMRNRAKEVGATCQVDSVKGIGTKISIKAKME